MSEPVREELAVCTDCNYRDGTRGSRGRGAQHATATGHEVTTSLITRWPRRGPAPGQTTLDDEIRAGVRDRSGMLADTTTPTL